MTISFIICIGNQKSRQDLLHSFGIVRRSSDMIVRGISDFLNIYDYETILTN